MLENWTDQNADQYLSSIPSEWVLDVVNAAENGYLDPLLAFTRLYRLHKLVTDAAEQIKALAVSEAQKYPKTFQFHGCEIQNKSSAGRWDFKGVEEWNRQKATLASIEERYKQAFTLREKGMSLVTDDGEELNVEGVKYTPGADTIAIKFIS